MGKLKKIGDGRSDIVRRDVGMEGVTPAEPRLNVGTKPARKGEAGAVGPPSVRGVLLAAEKRDRLFGLFDSRAAALLWLGD